MHLVVYTVRMCAYLLVKEKKQERRVIILKLFVCHIKECVCWNETRAAESLPLHEAANNLICPSLDGH